jgi:hypothetical protein
MRFTRTFLLLPFFLLLLILAACSTKSAGSPAGAIEAYNQALVAKNADQLNTLSCKAWEADAKTELDSFSAVNVTLKDQKCQESGKDGDITLVSCTGTISADYNGEIMEINLEDHTYQAVQEGGEWRMCGYR